jgi:hypothetical protein
VLSLIHTLQFTIARTKSSQSAVSSPVDVPLLLGSCPHRLAAISHQPPTLTAISRLPCNGTWSLLYSLIMDRTENTASNSYCIVVLNSPYIAMTISHCLFCGRCLATGLHVALFILFIVYLMVLSVAQSI